ncbi:hypothetical protein BGZ59_004651 [Podila verticillata]|nr:hypothetical protein BGZ59_004651 [Podila verticillata]
MNDPFKIATKISAPQSEASMQRTPTHFLSTDSPQHHHPLSRQPTSPSTSSSNHQYVQLQLESDFENKTATIEEIESDSEIHATNARVQSKSEIKARKALAKVGLKKVSGIERVTIRRSGQPILAISQPDVYMSTNSDTHIVFGEAQSEDFNLQSQLQAAEDVLKEAGEPSAEAVEAAEEEDEEEVDEEGVDAGDIELVVAQANVSRAKAVKALKNNNNDIVNAIMELTM